jgi:hypothetical protein
MPEIFKKNEAFLGVWIKGARVEITAPLRDWIYCFLFLLRRAGAGWVTLTGSEAGKAVLETPFKRAFELALTRLLAVALALVAALVVNVSPCEANALPSCE